MESIRKLENMKKHQAFLPSGFSSNLAALQMVSLLLNSFPGLKYTVGKTKEICCKVNSVQEACAKCFAVHLLKFEILQTT